MGQKKKVGFFFLAKEDKNLQENGFNFTAHIKTVAFLFYKLILVSDLQERGVSDRNVGLFLFFFL